MGSRARGRHHGEVASEVACVYVSIAVAATRPRLLLDGLCHWRQVGAAYVCSGLFGSCLTPLPCVQFVCKQ